MGDDSSILREDGYIHVIVPIKSLTYHNNLNIILVRTATREVCVLDVNSGVILQTTCLSAGKFIYSLILDNYLKKSDKIYHY